MTQINAAAGFDAKTAGQIQRASRRAALLSALGFVVIGLAFAWSAYKLRGLDQQVDQKQNQIEQKQIQISALQTETDTLNKLKDERVTEIASLAQQKDALAQQKDALAQQIAQLQAEAEALQKQYALTEEQWSESVKVLRNSDSELLRTAPIQTVVQPKAAAKKGGDGLYTAKIWLDVPAGRIEEIERVSYLFNHPSFRNKALESSDRASKFAVSYRGWGALRHVIITLHLRGGRTQEIAFDMAEALGLAKRAAAGEKEAFVRDVNPEEITGKVPFEDYSNIPDKTILKPRDER